jgi:hypothetical protein
MKNKFAIFAGAVIVVAVAVFVGIMMSSSSQPTACALKDGNLVIDGMFGTSVPLTDISSLELTDTTPDIQTRTNGSSLGGVHKGEYLLTDGSKARLYIDENNSPFILFLQGDTVFYINLDSAEATQSFFSELQAAIG